MSSVAEYHDLLALGLKEPIENELPSTAEWDWEFETQLPPFKPWLLLILIPAAIFMLAPLMLLILIVGSPDPDLEYRKRYAPDQDPRRN